jgi:hypothetical protein
MKTSSDRTADTALPYAPDRGSGYRSRCVTERVPEANLARRGARVSSAAVVSKSLSMCKETAGSSCMQKLRRMRHQHGVQRAARVTSRARRPRISPSFLAHSGDVLGQRRALARAQAALSRAERRFPTWPRRRWSGPEVAGLLPNAAAKFGVGASSVSRALAKPDDEAPVTSVTGASSSPSPHGAMRMIVFPLRRSVGLRAATASSRVATSPMLVRSRPSRTRWTISLSWARSGRLRAATRSRVRTE